MNRRRTAIDNEGHWRGATRIALFQHLRPGGGIIGRFADWLNSRRWFIRYLLYAE
jgi:hypothetical protein